MPFLLEGPFGDFGHKPGGYNYWVFATVCYCHNQHLHTIAGTLPAWIESYAYNSVFFLD